MNIKLSLHHTKLIITNLEKVQPFEVLKKCKIIAREREKCLTCFKDFHLKPFNLPAVQTSSNFSIRKIKVISYWKLKT